MPLTTRTVYTCDSCDHRGEDPSGVPLYECVECGGLFSKNNGGGRNGTMCPDCGNKMGTRQEEEACDGCETGRQQEEEETIWECGFCGEEVEEDDILEHCKDNHGDEIITEWLASEHQITL